MNSRTFSAKMKCYYCCYEVRKQARGKTKRERFK